MTSKSRSRCDLIIELIDACLADVEDQGRFAAVPAATDRVAVRPY